MKTLLRFTLITACALLLLCGTAIAILSSPTIQENIFRSCMHRDFPTSKVGKIFLTFSSLEIHDLMLARSDTQIGIEQAHIHWKFGSLLSRQPLHITRCEVSGATLNHTPIASTPNATPHKATSTISTQAHHTPTLTPYLEVLSRFQIDQLNLKGALISGLQSLQFEISSQGVRPAVDSIVTFQGLFQDHTPKASVQSYDLNGTLQIAYQSKPTPQSVTLDAKLKAQSTNLKQPLLLNINGTSQPTHSGERYTIDLSRSLSKGLLEPLAHVEANLQTGNQTLLGKFEASITDADLAPLINPLTVPKFNLQLQGTIEHSLKEQTTQLISFCNLDAQNLERLDAQLRDFPAIQLRSQCDLTWSQDTMNLKVMHAELHDLQGNTLLQAKLTQPCLVHLQADGLKITKAKGELARIEIPQLPLGYITPFVQGLKLQGDPLSGVCALTIDDRQTLTLETLQPFKATHLTVTHLDQVLCQGLNCELQAQCTYNGKTLTLNYPNLSILQDTGNLLVSLDGTTQITLDSCHIQSAQTQGQLTAYLHTFWDQPFIRRLYPNPLSQPVALSLDYNLAYDVAANLLHIQQLACALKSNLQQPKSEAFASLETLKPFYMNFKNGFQTACNVPDKGDLAILKFNSCPVQIINPFLNGLTLHGETLQGSIILSSADMSFGQAKPISSLNFRTEPALDITRVNVRLKGQSLLQDAVCHLECEGGISYPQCKATWKPLSVQLIGAAQPILYTSGDCTLNLESILQPFPAVNLKLVADLSRIMHLATTKQTCNIDSGVLELQAQTESSNNGPTFKTQLALKKLNFIQPRTSIELLTCNLSGTLAQPNTLNFSSPIVIKGLAGLSEMTVSGTLTPQNPAQKYTLTINGKDLYLDDCLLLPNIWLSQSTTPSTTPSTQATTAQKADTAAFWTPGAGNVALNVQSLHYGTCSLTNLQAKAALTPTDLDLSLQGNLLQAPCNMSAHTTFDAQKKEPYTLKGSATVGAFPIHKLLASVLNVNTAPIDGTFDLQGQCTSSGIHQHSLINNLRGILKIHGQNGSIKTFAASSPGVQLSTTAISLAGAFLGSQVKELDFAGQVISFFSNIPYNTLDITVQRGATADIIIQPLILRGPEVYMVGQGKIQHVPQVPIMQQPMLISARMDGKGKAGQLLTSLGLASDQTTPEGYLSGPTFQIKGTPGNPDFSQLYSLLSRPKVSRNQAPSGSSSSAPSNPVGEILNLFR